MKSKIKKTIKLAALALGIMALATNAEAAYTDDCITFTSKGAFSLSAPRSWDGTMWTSVDKTTWNEWDGNEVTAAQAGGTGDYHLYVRGDGENTTFGCNHSPAGSWCLTPAGENTIACSGNIETLRGATGDNPSGTSMGYECYAYMFKNCTSLTAAPALPATELAENCYGYMFSDCASLTAAPALPATALAESCYGYMFSDCASLTAAPALPATALEAKCYEGMFQNCTSLTNAPALPATELSDYCYYFMFERCSLLVVNKAAPGTEWKIPATTTTAIGWGDGMFGGTDGDMTGTPELNTTYYVGAKTTNCVTFSAKEAFGIKMRKVGEPLWDLSTLQYSTDQRLWRAVSVDKDYDAELDGDTYKIHFRGVGIIAFADGTSAYHAFTNTESSAATAIACSGNIMSLCNYKNPILEILNEYTFCNLFNGFTALTAAPELPATKLTQGCYQGMFEGCTSLKDVPELPATTLAESCYEDMFAGCTSLEVNSAAPGKEWRLPSAEEEKNWNLSMFDKTKGDVEEPELNTTYYIASAPTVEVEYVDENGQKQTVDATVVESSDSRVTWETGWYVVTNEVAIPKGADCSGAVNLILADTGKLTISGVDMLKAGIKVSGDNDSLAIYGQTAGTGTLNVAGDSDVGGAGIGGGGGVDGGGVGSNITINGGTVNATGGNASAGIGGRCDYGCSNIVINAGKVIAKGGINAAGIGGGLNGNGSYITINGGTVTATSGGDNGAGIGGGGAINGYGSYIYINGGTVTANGGASASGIGGGNCGGASDIYVADYVILRADGNNPPMTEITHTSGQDISSSLTGQRYATAVTPIEVAYVDADGKTQTTNAIPVLASDTRAAWIEGWYVVNSDVKIPMGVYCSGAVNLILADGAKLTIDGMDDNDSGIGVTGVNSLAIYGQSAGTGTLNVAGGSGCAGIGGNATSNGSGITINGGVVTATGGDCAAGIGGGYYGSGSNIVINAGTVTANGTNGGAGIGGGYNGAGSNITINGGTVTANGGEYAAGIGGGESGSASYIYVADNIVLKADGSNPPTTVITHTSIKDDISSLLAGKQYVTAVATVKVSYLDAEGQTQTTNAIPVLASGTRVTWDAGWYVVTNEVTVTGGAECTNAVHLILADGAKLTIDGVDMSKAGIKVTGDNSLAIYGQAQGTGALDVTGGMLGAGIGGGNGGAAQNITINGGMVTAKGGKFAAGIGGGFNGNGSYITINGGVVTANGGANAVGIGGGAGGDASNIKAADSVIIKAGNSQNPTTVIAHDSTTDLSNDNNFSGKQYVTAEMLPPVAIVATPTAVENATFEVYTNGFLSAEIESGKWAAWSNRTAKVVYTANAGYMFVDGSTVFTNDLDTAVNPAVNKDGKNPGPAIYTCKREELEAGQSTNLVEHFTFTAAPTTAFGGVFKVNEGATLTGKNVVFKGNESNNGGAIYNKGTVSLKDTAFMGNKARSAGGAIANLGTLSLGGVTFEGNAAPKGGAIYNYSSTINFAGPVTLVTETDTIYNSGTLNWNLAGGKAGVLNGYQNVTNGSTKAVLQLTVEEYTTLPTNIVFATGDFSNIATAGTDTFSITNATVGGGTVTAKINGGFTGIMGSLLGYKLMTEEKGDTTNLVLHVEEHYTCVREEVTGTKTLEEDFTYTAAPATGKGGTFLVNPGAMLVGTNVIFTANKSTFSGGAICNSGMVALKDAIFKDNMSSSLSGAIFNDVDALLFLDGVTFDGNEATSGGGAIFNASGAVNFIGRVTLKTASDTINNEGTLNWNLADGKAGVLNGYDKLTNIGTLLLTVEDYAAPTNIVFATGDMSDVEGKDTFSITNIDQQVAAITGVKIGDAMILSADGLTGYKLVTEEVLSVPTTNLVLQITQYTCKREVLKDGQSTNLVAGVYTAAPTMDKGGAFSVNGGATLTGKNVVFTGNETNYGGAICNTGTVSLKNASFMGNQASPNGGAILSTGTLSLDGVTFEGNTALNGGAICNGGKVNFDGSVTLVKATDTIFNKGTLNWNLADGKAGVLNGYDKLTNSSGTLLLTVEDYAAPTNIVFATGDMADVEGKDTFSITNIDQQVAAITGVKIDGNMILSADGLTGYKLVTEEVLSVPTTNLVLQVTQYTCKRVELEAGQSTNLVERFTYTAAPTEEMRGGVFFVNGGATLTGTNVVFKDNEAKYGGAICILRGTVSLTDANFTGNKAKFGSAINSSNGTLSLDGVTFDGNEAKNGGAIYNGSSTVHFDGPVTLVTDSDTISNYSTLNWNLAGGKAGCLNGYDKLTNSSGTLLLTVEEYTTMPTNFVIATGDFTSVSGKDTFTVTNVTTGASFTLKIGEPTTYLGDYAYSLAVTGDSTNRQLVFTVGYGQFAVDFNANGGVHTNGLEIVTGNCSVHTGYEFPTVTREGYTFKGWYDSWTNNATKVTSPTPLLKYAEHTLYAQWTSKATTISAKGELYLPDLVSGKPVTNVVKGAYNKNKKLKTLVTSLYLKEIGEYAFSGCSQLKSVTINATRNYEDNTPTPLTIARNTFSGCTALEEVYIAGEVTDLGQSAFQGCAKLKKIVFAGTNTVTVGSSAFARCGYNNGEGKIYVYMSQEFRDNNTVFLDSLAKWFVADGVELVRKVDATPATGVATIDVDFSKLGTDRKLAVMIKTNVTGKPDVRTVDIQYRASLEAGDWTTLKADSKTAFAGGSVLVEITVPDGNSGFLRAITVKEEN